MQTSAKEPKFLVSDDQVSAQSPIAREFIQRRSQLNDIVSAADDAYVKRFYNLDHNAYLEGAVPAKYKELMGLSASAVLRCDDCIYYHIIQGYRLGCERLEIQEALNVGLIIGGSIVIPHLRRAHALIAELYATS